MKDNANDILVDYEGLCGQLVDILKMLDLASQGYEERTTESIINTSRFALKYLITMHDTLTREYRKELSEHAISRT